MKLPSNAKTIFVCFVGWLFDFYDLVLISYLLPQISHTFSLGTSGQSWILGIGLGASGFGGMLFGRLGDLYGRKKIMTWTILLYSIGTALSALAPSALVFTVVRAIAALGLGGEWAVGHALVAETADQKRRGSAASFLQSGEPVGVGMAAIVGFLVAPLVGWRVVLFLSGLTGVWSYVVRKHVAESSLWEKERPEVVSLGRSWLATPRGMAVFLLSLGLAIFKLGTYWTCYVWLPQLFQTKFNEPIGRSLLWIMTAQVGQFLGMQIFGIFSDRFGRRLSFSLYSLLSAAALASLAFQWSWLLGHRLVFWPVMFLLGVGSGCTAGFGVLLAELFPTSVRNFAMGTIYNSARSVQFLAPFVVVAAMSRWDVAGALGVPLVLAVLTALWVWTLPETKDRSLDFVGDDKHVHQKISAADLNESVIG